MQITNTTIQGIELIKHFEGFRNTLYICSGGFPTIGYGHKLSPHENYCQITKEQATKLLIKDLLATERAVNRYININLKPHQFDALVSFTFNVGAAALQRSTLRQKINYQLFAETPREFARWIYAGGRRIPGLIKRRHIESNLFLYNYI